MIDVGLDEGVVAALRASNLATVDEARWPDLVADARRVTVAAGTSVHRQGDTTPHCELVLTGLVRVYVTAPDGRTMTIRYCRPGALLGVASLYHRSFSLPASIQAVTDVDLLGLRPGTVVRAGERDPATARALLAELSERAMSFLAEIPGGVFATVPQRVARHLLDLASGTQRGPELVATVGQQELAEAVGSVREVVVRALRRFRAAGLVRTERGRVVIVDPEGLLDEAYDGRRPDQWNQSRRRRDLGHQQWRS